MKLLCQALCRIFVLLALTGILQAAQPEPARRSAPPVNLLIEHGQWLQSGDWKVGANGAAATAGETLADLTSKQAYRLRGRWLSFKAALKGENVKAGLWFAGVQDARGEILRLTIDC